MSLQNLQAEFIDSLYASDAERLVIPEQNMQIYANNIESNMVAALSDTYSLISQILGKNFFTMAAQQYVERYPSRSPDLHEYGEYFDSFIAEFEPAKDFVYLSEVARFEWTCHEIYFAPDHASFDRELLSSIQEENFENLHFTLNPACRVQRFMYPMTDIIELCRNERDENVDLDKGGNNLLIIRRNIEIKIQTLSDPAFILLSHLQDNMPLSVALEEALAVDPEFDLETALPEWISNHIIVDCSIIQNN